MLVCLVDVFTGIADVSVGCEDFVAYDVEFFSLFVDDGACFGHYVMDVHDAFRYCFDLVIFLLHKTSFHLKLDLQILLLVKRILMSLITTSMSKFIPCASCVFISLLILWALCCWKFFFFHFYLFRWEGFVIIGWIQKLLSSVPLNSKLLLCSSNLSRCIWIEVGLLKLNKGIFNLLDAAVDDWLLSLKAGENGDWTVDSYWSVEAIVAIF